MNGNKQMVELMAQYLSKEDVYASRAIAAVSVLVLKERARLGLTQKEFAKKLGVSQSMISKFESANYNFTLELIAQICSKLEHSFEISFIPENEYIKLLDNSSQIKIKPLKETNKTHSTNRTSIQYAA